MLPTHLADKYGLIDGDLIRYRVGFALDAQEAGADRIREFLDVTLRSFSDGDPAASGRGEIWLSGPENFRESIGTHQPYKGNRKDRAKPRYYEEIGETLKERYKAKVTVGIEADDAIAMALSADPKGRVCISFDKDMLQVSGWHYNWLNNTAQWITRKAGDFKLYQQILTGDPTDNVRGIEGVGPVTASKILEGATSSRDLCQRAWAAYRANNLSAEYFREISNLVYLLRSPDDRYQAPIELT